MLQVVNGEGVGIGWQKKARKKGMEQQPIQIKKSVSNKQHNLISSTRKINPLTPVLAVTGRAKTHSQFPVPAVTGRKKACENNCLP